MRDISDAGHDAANLNRHAVHVLIFILLVITGLTIYKPAFHYSYSAYDDAFLIVDNDYLNKGITRRGLAWAFSINDRIATYLPVTWVSHMLDFEFFGTDYSKHHATNILLHTVNACLVYLLILQISKTHTLLSLTVAAIFLVHPLQTEVVVWIAGRKDLLATMFGVSSLFMYLLWLKKPDMRMYLASLTAYILSLASKSTLLAFPLLLVVCDLCFSPLSIKQMKKTFIHILVTKIPFLIFSFSFGITGILGTQLLKISTGHQLKGGDQVFNALINLKDYVADIFYPLSLCIYYPLIPHTPFEIAATLAGFLFILLLLLFIAARYQKPDIAFGICFFILCLIPFIGLYQVSLQARANRYAYLAMIGPVFLATRLYFFIPGRSAFGRIGLMIVPAMLISFLIHRTMFQVSLWEDDVTLFEYCAQHTSSNDVAFEILSRLYMEQQQYPAAQSWLDKAMAVSPHYGSRHLLQAQIHEATGRIEPARLAYNQALMYPNVPGNAYYLALMFKLKNGPPQDVSLLADKALTKITNGNFLNNIGTQLETMGFKHKAKAFYTAALDINPGLMEARYNLAFLLWEAHDHDLAIGHIQQCMQQNPDDPEIQSAFQWMKKLIEEQKSSS